ncbi:MAG: AAA family ATPase [Bacteroidales bacterium]|nr:AAA family ATPase [Bacteroidales bacterium]
MKIRKIHIDNYKILKNFDLDLTLNNKPLNFVVLAGINGTGKTSIFEFLETSLKTLNISDNSYIEIEEYNSRYKKNEIFTIENKQKYKTDLDIDINLEELLSFSEHRIIYFKAGKINTTAKEIIIEYIDKLIYEEDLKSSEAYIKVQEILSKIFYDFELQVEFNMLDKQRNIYFKNEISEKIKIDDLSGGEKELITKAFPLLILDIKNSVILIDEPEYSLHPKWQNRIVKIYEDFANKNNNQIIFATHSPHIIASTKKESLKLLIKNNKKIEVFENFEGSYGWEVNKILIEIMELDSLRTPVIETKLDCLKKLIIENKTETKEFILLHQELENILGINDVELSLLRVEINKRKQDSEKNK